MKENGKTKLGIENIKCPECGVLTPAEEWREVEVGCEDCGSHDGLLCPNCEEDFDHVWGFDKLIKNSDLLSTSQE